MEQPPAGTDPKLVEYLVRHLSKLEEAAADTSIPLLTALPAKPFIGKLYYFSNTIGSTITTIGVWVYKSTGWSYLG